ncbi:MAG: hypothetical protein IJ523_05090 [Succinivibrionaceae bacterium]|nr:hypothetical protein [Succinivibrionaceae bacterium]
MKEDKEIQAPEEGSVESAETDLMTEEERLESEAREAKKKIEIDRYLMIDDESKRSGMVKSAVLLTVTAVVVATVLVLSVTRTLSGASSASEVAEKNRSIFLNNLEKKYGADPAQRKHVLDFRFDGSRFLMSRVATDASMKLSGDLEPENVMAAGYDFFAESLCNNAENIIRRQLAIDEVDYIFFQGKNQLYTVKVTMANCRQSRKRSEQGGSDQSGAGSDGAGRDLADH